MELLLDRPEAVFKLGEADHPGTVFQPEVQPCEDDQLSLKDRLSNRIMRSRMGKLAAATLCSLALIGVLSPESAAQNSYPSVDNHQAVTKTDKGVYGVGDNLIAACPNPPATAPTATQLRAFSCLMIQAQKSASDSPVMSLYSPLNQSALLKTEDVINCGFSHYACDEPFTYHMPKEDESGNTFNCFGENLAWGSDGYGSMQSLFRALMASPTHRRNIENPSWDYYGSAIIRDGNTNYLTTHFTSYDKCSL